MLKAIGAVVVYSFAAYGLGVWLERVHDNAEKAKQFRAKESADKQ